MIRLEGTIHRNKRLIVQGFAVCLFMVLFLKLGYLMIFKHNLYKNLSEANAIRPVVIYPPRAVIYDREGKLLATNKASYNLFLTKAEIKGEEEVWDHLSSHTGINRDQLESNFRLYYRGKFLPTLIAKDISIEQVSLIEERKDELPGVSYTKVPIRLYPENEGVLMTHLLGYLSEISKKELEKDVNAEYLPGDLVGAQGIEKQYERIFKGVKGYKYIKVDALGRDVGTVEDRSSTLPKPAENKKISIDCSVQALAETLLGDRRGAAVLMNANTGAVLALASTPDFDPNQFSGVITRKTWWEFLEDPDKPLLNRVTLGLYPPGSAYKMIALAAAIEDNKVDPNWSIFCDGGYEYGGRVFRCWEERGHGVVDMRRGLMQSCNIYFFQLMQRIDFDTWSRIAEGFGFGKLTGIDLPDESLGILPNRNFLEKKYGVNKWPGGILLNLAIGQGEVLVTPIQMARYIAMIATRGKMVYPWIVDAPDLNNTYEETQADLLLKPKTWDTIQKLTFDVVNTPGGTAYGSRISDVSIEFHGKTGTAENPHGKPHAWFVGYAKKGDELIAVSVVLENRGHGSDYAAPIAREMVQKYFEDTSHELVAQR